MHRGSYSVVRIGRLRSVYNHVRCHCAVYKAVRACTLLLATRAALLPVTSNSYYASVLNTAVRIHVCQISSKCDAPLLYQLTVQQHLILLGRLQQSRVRMHMLDASCGCATGYATASTASAVDVSTTLQHIVRLRSCSNASVQRANSYRKHS
jgi:hypothetical protein